MEADHKALLQKAFLKYQSKYGHIDIKELALRCDLAYGNVYNPIYKNRDVNPGIWLKLMIGLEAARISKDRIVIMRNAA